MYLIRLCLVVVLFAVIAGCEAQQKENKVDHVSVIVSDLGETAPTDSSLYKSAEGLLDNLTTMKVDEAKSYCLYECALGYFLKRDINEYSGYQINKAYIKNGLGLVEVTFNNLEVTDRLVFTDNYGGGWKYFFLWPKKFMTWDDCIPEPELWDMVYQLAEEESVALGE